MNITVTYLSLTGSLVFSPVFAGSARVSLSNSVMRNFFSSAAILKGRSVFSSCSFARMLDTAVVALRDTHEFISCSFADCHGNANGGAINATTSGDVIVTGCSFLNCSSTNNAGAVYVQLCSSFSISQSCFSYCEVESTTDNWYGNGLYSYYTPTVCYLNTFYRTSCDPSRGGDSTSCFNGAFVKIRNYNASYCFGHGGGVGGCVIYHPQNSTVKFETLTNSGDACCFVLEPAISEYSFNNLVNNSQCLFLFWNKAELLTVSNTAIINCSKALYGWGGTNPIEFVGSVSDYDYGFGIAVNSSPQTNKLDVQIAEDCRRLTDRFTESKSRSSLIPFFLLWLFLPQ